MSFKDNKGLWSGVAALVVIAAVLIWILASAEPFRLVILFDDIGALKKGDPVLWKGFEIGKVEDIKPLVENRIGVTIRIKEDYARNITHGAEFILKRSALLGLLGRDAVEITTPSEPGAPYERGERVQGKSTPKPSLIQQGTELGLSYWNQLKDEASRVAEEFRRSPYRTDVEQALDQVKTLAQQGASQAKDGLAQFQKDHKKDLEDAIAKLKNLRDKLLKKGDQSGAKRLDQGIEKLEQGLRP